MLFATYIIQVISDFEINQSNSIVILLSCFVKDLFVLINHSNVFVIVILFWLSPRLFQRVFLRDSF